MRRYQHSINQYPRSFWLLLLAVFIDHIGSAMMYPFLALYVTQHFQVGMTQAGQLFAIFSISAMAGSTLGGALADKFGRKRMILFGMLASATSSLFLGLVNQLSYLYLVAAFSGVLANTGSPAQNAMVADLLPQEKQASGFGMIRVAFNISFAIGPVIGGFLANQNFLLIFLLDAVISFLTALFFFLFIPETKPQPKDQQPMPSLLQTFGGYFKVIQDRLFMLVIAALVLVQVVYEQLNTTLPVFLRDVHGVPPSQFGFLLSLNALMVVFLQLWVTQRTEKFSPMLVMAASSGFYLLGFGMFAFTAQMGWFVLSMVLITIGEMAMSPVLLASVSRFATEDMRARYMAVFEFGWVFPNTFASLLGGLVLDHLNPNWLWLGCGMVAACVLMVYLLLHKFGGDKLRVPDQKFQHWLQSQNL